MRCALLCPFERAVRLVGAILLLAGAGLGLLPATAPAQTPSTPFPSWLSVSGNAGLRAEGYAASITPQRQPGLSSEAFASLSVEAFGATTGIDLLYSTENNDLRQSMNRLSFNTSWDWGEVSAGTVSPDYSQYSLNGATLRGGAVELTPGSWTFGTAVGRSQRAVEPSTEAGFRRPAYARWLYAGQVGLGAENGSHFHLIGTYARDRRSSLEATPDVRPKENMTVTPDVQVALFDQHLTLDTEVTLSVFTPDTRARTATPDAPFIDVIPFEPRVGTHVDVAGKSRLQLDVDPVRIEARYERIQPGFRSLGLSRIRGDQETISLRPQVRLFDSDLTLSLNAQQTRNNLSDQRLTTRRRRRIGGNVQARFSRSFSLNGALRYMTSETSSTGRNDSLGTALERQLNTWTASLTPTLTVRSGAVSHTVSVTGNLQFFRSRRAVSTGTNETRRDNLTTTFSYSLSFPSGFAFTLSGDFLRNSDPRGTSRSYGTSGSISHAFLDSKLQLSVNAGWSADRRSGGAFVRRAQQYRAGIDASYQLPFGEQLHVAVKNLVNRSRAGRDYRETRVSMRYSHSF